MENERMFNVSVNYSPRGYIWSFLVFLSVIVGPQEETKI